MKTKETITRYKAGKKKWTYSDYVNLPDDHNRYEMLEGELLMTPSPVTIHQQVSRELGFHMISFVKKNNLGEVFIAPLDVKFSETNVTEPDLLFVPKENKEIIKEENIQGAPDLIVEILSPYSSEIDKGKKKDIYQKFGVKEYWIIEPTQQWIEIFILQDDKYKLHQQIEKSGKIFSEVLKGFDLDIGLIF